MGLYLELVTDQQHLCFHDLHIPGQQAARNLDGNDSVSHMKSFAAESLPMDEQILWRKCLHLTNI